MSFDAGTSKGGGAPARIRHIGAVSAHKNTVLHPIPEEFEEGRGGERIQQWYPLPPSLPALPSALMVGSALRAHSHSPALRAPSALIALSHPPALMAPSHVIFRKVCN
jgi:hypothetical protein